jgi:putative FmdB family regulatory protein
MPTYEYTCQACGHRFEKFQRMSDAPVNICPACGGQVRRLPGAGAGVIFKSGGVHATDDARSETGSSIRCGRQHTCCGRDERCASPPCHE